MKKLLAFIAAGTLAATAAFANVELDLNYQAIIADNYFMTNEMTSDSTQNLTTQPLDRSLSYILTAPLGADLNVNIFFGKSPRKFEAGLHFGLGFAVPTEVTVNDDGTETKLVETLKKNDPKGLVQAGGFGASFEIGPVFRFSLNQTHQFSITPSLFFRFDALAVRNSVDEMASFGDFAMGIDLDAGYKLWLVNKSGFHFGLNTGVGLEIPTFATGLFEDGSSVLLTSGSEFGFKVYLGVCFNFGDRGVDR